MGMGAILILNTPSIMAEYGMSLQKSEPAKPYSIPLTGWYK